MFGLPKKKHELLDPFDNRVLAVHLESQKWTIFADDQNRGTMHLKDLPFQAGAVLSVYRVLELGDYRYQVKGALVFRQAIKKVKPKINKAEYVMATITGPDISTRGITYSAMLRQTGLSNEKIAQLTQQENNEVNK